MFYVIAFYSGMVAVLDVSVVVFGVVIYITTLLLTPIF